MVNIKGWTILKKNEKGYRFAVKITEHDIKQLILHSNFSLLRDWYHFPIFYLEY